MNPNLKKLSLPWRVAFRGSTIAAFRYKWQAQLFYRGVCQLCEANHLDYALFSIDPSLVSFLSREESSQLPEKMKAAALNSGSKPSNS